MTEQVLLALKVGFLVVLFLFIWRVIRVSRRDLRAPQESMVLGAAAAEAAGLGRAPPQPFPPAGEGPRLLVLSSPIYPPGPILRLDSHVPLRRPGGGGGVLAGDAYGPPRAPSRFPPGGPRH